jgi:predicted ester cyclase
MTVSQCEAILLPSIQRGRNIMGTASQQNEDTVRTCLTEASRGNYEVFDTILTPDYVVHPEEARGAAGLQEMVDGYRAALSNLRVDIEQQFSAGDRVATVSTIRGVHEGDLMGTPPTGREVAFAMITISRFEDGRIAEEWEIADTVALLAQIGALPEPAHSS